MIVGAGPGGCAAAIALRRRGAPAHLLDRARFPRDKVCGDVLLPAALDALRDLGLPVEELRRLGTVCHGARIVFPGGRDISGPFDGVSRDAQWLIVRRLVFDNWLLDRARDAGARVTEETEVTGVRRSGDGAVTGLTMRRGSRREQVLESSGVLAADGASSRLAGLLGSRPVSGAGLGVAARGYARGVGAAAEVEVHLAKETLPGCVWVVPAGGDSWNVGLGYVRAAGRRSAPAPAALLGALRESLPGFRERLNGSAVEDLRGWFLPLAPGRDRLHGRGWLLAGDAAGLIDPLTGHGIHNAIRSGVLAGEALAPAASSGEAPDPALLAAYEATVRGTIVKQAMRHGVLRRLMRHPSLATALSLVAGWTPVKRRLLAVVGHAAPGARAA